MNEIEIWEFLEKELKARGKAAIVIVAASSESSPGRQGFKMAVSITGEIRGTIGGGVLEAKVIKETVAFLKAGKRHKLMTLIHDPESPAAKSGLICGGSQTLIIYGLTSEHSALVSETLEILRKKERRVLTVSNNEIILQNKIDGSLKKHEFSSRFTEFEYKEIIGRKETAYIIGGGHVGKEISRELSFLGFYVVVIDNREKLFTLENNKFADKIIHTDYKNISEYIEEGELSYVIIVSPKHITDKIALASAIKLNVKYIGMMGSVKKIEAIYELLEKEGIDKQLLEKVHSPIGLPINSETPQEIAVSVAAEIIKIKNGS